MIARDGGDGCGLVAVGERKVCPQGKFDEASPGPNPLYVDGADGTPDPDGSQAKPFHTITDAVEAGGQIMTIYVAAGDYHEQVALEGQSEVHLIGLCAEKTRIVGEGL
jgi:pectin methylesterase-like acyl-CoA thioesterase